MRFRGMILLTD
ncbi:hypothetical protein PTE_02529 [Photorhabdus khanii NC19]|uniref:Uncharacterized protein n=1 Tax=Photorhabdus khanii NC19 TaxID=1004151 RepID=W3V8K4_9GAMM|nr:hypothetical protein PTE_02529 [Photorhabdus khanii NC19]